MNMSLCVLGDELYYVFVNDNVIACMYVLVAMITNLCCPCKNCCYGKVTNDTLMSCDRNSDRRHYIVLSFIPQFLWSKL